MVKLTELYILKEDLGTYEEMLGSSTFQEAVYDIIQSLYPTIDPDLQPAALAYFSAYIGPLRWTDDPKQVEYSYDMKSGEGGLGPIKDTKNMLKWIRIASKPHYLKKAVQLAIKGVHDIATSVSNNDEASAKKHAEKMFRAIKNSCSDVGPEGYAFNAPQNVFLKLDNGWAWHRVRGQDNKERLSSLMGHCIAEDQDGEIYSLRDKNGTPEVTAAVIQDKDGPVLDQVSGADKPGSKYAPAVRALVKKLGIVDYARPSARRPGRENRPEWLARRQQMKKAFGIDND